MITQHAFWSVVFCGAVCCAAPCSAATVPFVEDFTNDAANWLNLNGTALLTFNAAGGPDGGSYAAGTFNFQNSVAGDTPVILRGTTSILGEASDGNLFGNWPADGAKIFNVQVRHNASLPLTFFTRFADPANFPGATAIHFAPVFPNTWTELEVEVRPGNPQFVTFEGESFAQVFDNIGNVQIGVSAPAALAGVNQVFAFDIDKVSLRTPEPTAAALAVFSGLAGLITIRRRYTVRMTD